MVNFNLPTTNKNVAPTLIAPSVDRSVLQAASSATATEGEKLNAQLNDLNRATAEARRTALVAKESQDQLNLQLPDALRKLENINVNAIAQISAIDEAKRKAEQNKTDAAYNLNSLLQFQTEFNAFSRQAESQISGDGAGHAEAVQSFINENMNKYLSQAPSEDAKLELYSKLSTFKLQAMDRAFSLEDKQRNTYRINLATDGVTKLTNEVLTNPQFADAALSQLAPVEETLRQNGVDENGIAAFIASSKASIVNAQVNGLLKSSTPQEAMSVLSSDLAKSSLPASHYERLVDETGRVMRTYIEEQKKAAENAVVLQSFAAGYLPKGAKGFDDAADTAASQMLFSRIGDTSAMTAESVPTVASEMSAYFKQYNAGIGKNTNNIIANKLLVSKNPYEVAAYAIGMDSLSKDPSGNKSQPFLDLPEEARVMATRVANLASFGIDPKDAVDMARKAIQSTKVGGVNIMSNPEIAKTVRDSVDGIVSDLGANAIDAAYISAEARSVYESFLTKYNDPDIAKQETEKAVKFKYAETNVDGESRVMEAAPELYYSGDLLDKFKENLATSKQQIAAAMNLDSNDLFLRAIPNRTASQDRLDKKQYYVYNKRTGLPVQDKDYNFAVFTFAVDQTDYGAKLKEANAALAARRDQLNQLAAANEGVIKNWVLSSKVDRSPLKQG